MTNRKKTPYMDFMMARYYAEASAKHQFVRPAQDLVAWLEISETDRILDIGSGTGMIASAVARMSASVVAIDSSIEMLRQQKPNDRIAKVLADAPQLPFEDQVFDRAAAGFVISHIPDYASALREVLRVLRHKGTFGATAWGSGTPRVSEVWKSTIQEFVNIKPVQEEFARIIPWDEFFAEREKMEHAFHTAGFVNLKSSTNDYLISVDWHQYISTKIGSIEGTIVREALKDEGWKRFLDALLSRLQEEFPNRIEFTRPVHFVSGKKPD
jgi:ubiquinone/menaquinone biosynthesis C-methylase UbiE